LPVTGYREQIADNTMLLANQVFVGGKMTIEARWPDIADPNDLLNQAAKAGALECCSGGAGPDRFTAWQK
jgi:hypothetical protein